jgi:hypothetical protein
MSMKWCIVFILVLLVMAILFVWMIFTNPFGMTDVKIVVQYAHQWSGGIGEGDAVAPYVQTGNYSLVMHKMFSGKWDVHVMAQKEDDSTDILRISIMTLDGKVLKSAMTSIPNEMIFAEAIL